MTGTGDVLAGRYELRDELGRGGMAVVFRGFDRVLERDVAIKLLGREHSSDEGFVRRFRREAQAAAGLSHRNAVAVHDTGTDDGVHYIVMELVDGPTLQDLLSREGPLGLERIGEIVRGVSAALAAAHERGLVHRDVKPGNIMIALDGQAKVADFGLARAVAASTRTGTAYGSAPYVAPEQARGDDVDHRADIYALGCVLHEMLTGQPPFDGDSPLAIVSQHLHRDPPRPTQLRADLPEEVDAVVATAMAKDPAHRYDDVGSFAADTERALEGRPPLLAPTPAATTRAMGEGPGGTDSTRILDDDRPETAALAGAGMSSAPPPEDGPDTRHAWAGRMVGVIVLLALAVSAVLIVLQLQEDEPPGETVAGNVDEPPPAADDEEPEAEPEDVVEDEPTEPASVRDAALDALELLDEAEDAGHIDKKSHDDVRKHVVEVMEEVRDGDWEDAFDALDDARKKLDEGLRRGRVTPGWARRIDRALDDLEHALRATAPSPSPSP